MKYNTTEDKLEIWSYDTFEKNRMLPTPRANKVNGCNLNSENLANRNKGNLEEMIAKMMSPTPAAADGGKTTSNSKQKNLNILAPVGCGSQLNPLFVEEMMGYPTGWLVFPFLSGERKASKPMETP